GRRIAMNLRLCASSKALLAPSRGLIQGSSKQGVLHMHEVRDKLREIVGASTNWRDHVKAMEERKLLHTFLAKSQKALPPRKMKDSLIEVLLPLGSEPELREKYLTVQNTVRFGRILEDLDSLGGTGITLVPLIHRCSHTLNPVTRKDMCKQSLSPEQDIKLTGHVSWVGKTSMEVKMQMFQLHGDEFCPVLEATFVMVARDSENKG
uniref:Acyl-CoA thioesterase 9 n=1 Tax=Jaculus jaculus TaxID=51337 RepID=A0A8C5JZH7_JACJA